MATRAGESKMTNDPMKELWSEKKFKKRVTDKWLQSRITYNVSDAADHFIPNGTSEEKELYQKVVSEFFKGISIAMIQKNYPYTWYRVGEFCIAKFNGSPAINSLKSKQHKKLVSFVNLHTSGWIYMFYWNKKRTIFYNRDFYEFKASNGVDFEWGKRGLRTWIRKLHEDCKLTDYNAFVRNSAMQWKRRKKREEENEKRKQEKEQKLKDLLK